MQESDFYKKFEHFLFGSLLHKISVDFFNSEGGRRLRGSSFLRGEAVSLQLGVVLVEIFFQTKTPFHKLRQCTIQDESQELQECRYKHKVTASIKDSFPPDNTRTQLYKKIKIKVKETQLKHA